MSEDLEEIKQRQEQLERYVSLLEDSGVDHGSSSLGNLECQCPPLSCERRLKHSPYEKGDVMANDLEDSGEWRSTVESRLGTLETRVEDEARLRAAMDEDLGKLHVTRNMLQSLHDTQSDHTRRLTKLEDGQEELKRTLQEVHVGVRLIHDKLDRLIDTE